VGTVAAVKKDAAQSLADVDLRPAAALDRSRELMLVWLKPSAVLAPATATTPPTGSAAAAAERPSNATPAAKTPVAKASNAKASPAKGSPAKPPQGRTP
jgi:hypothetical protein